MSVAIIPLLITLLFSMVPFAGLIVLQVYLSELEQDWLGLILPILSGLISLWLTIIALLSLVSDFVLAALPWIILINVPSLIFFIIYKKVHKKKVPNKELDKMTIHDLS